MGKIVYDAPFNHLFFYRLKAAIGEVWLSKRILDLCERALSSWPECSSSCALLFLLYLILPEEFNLLPRVPSHNFFKSTFYETAIPFHWRPRAVNPICKASHGGCINMTKVAVCRPGPILSPPEAFLKHARLTTRVHRKTCSGDR